jgi:hypothetical protein
MMMSLRKYARKKELEVNVKKRERERGRVKRMSGSGKEGKWNV